MPDVIYSVYKDQPIYRDLLADFVSCLEERMEQSRSAIEGERWIDLSKIMHQLRGAAATYGFPTLAEAAAEIELASQESSVQESRIRDFMQRVSLIVKKIEAGMTILMKE